MALAIIPKSEIRLVTSIIHGYGSVPIAAKDGRMGWALPGQGITFCEVEALKAAKKLDQVIRAKKHNLPN